MSNTTDEELLALAKRFNEIKAEYNKHAEAKWAAIVAVREYAAHMQQLSFELRDMQDKVARRMFELHEETKS